MLNEQKVETRILENRENIQESPDNQKHSGSMNTIQELLNKSLAVYKREFWKFVGLMLMPTLSIAFFVIIGILFFSFLKKDSFAMIIFVLLIAAAFIFTIIVSLISQAAMFILAKNPSQSLEFKEIFWKGKKYAWKFFVVNFVAGFFILLWSLLFIIPGIIAALYYSVALWALFYEGLEGRAALKRSKELIKDYWWKVFWRFFSIYSIFYIIMIIPSLLSENTVMEIPCGIVLQIISFLAAPFFIIYSCFIYLDLVKIKGKSQ